MTKPRIRSVGTFLLFLGPFLLFFLVFHVTPLFGGVAISFSDFSLFSAEGEFVGLDNYIRAFKDPMFLRTLVNTGVYLLGIVPLFVISMIAALALHRVNRGRRAYQAILFLPYVIPVAVNGFIFTFLLAPQNGVFAELSRFFGLGGSFQAGLLTMPQTAIWAVIMVWIYVHMGYIMSILYNGLQEIPESYFEAARIDGAGPIRVFFSITLPLLGNVIVYVAVTSIVLAFQVFPLVWIMTGSGMGMGAGGPVGSTLSADLYIYQAAFRDNDLGLASAMGVLLLIVTFLLSLLPLRNIKEVSYD